MSKERLVKGFYALKALGTPNEEESTEVVFTLVMKPLDDTTTDQRSQAIK